MPSTNVSILGCGWLGLPLAKALIAQGYSVKGSTTNPQKLDVLKKNRIEAFLLNSNPHISGDRLNEFFQSEVMVITIPFRRDLEDPSVYTQQIASVAGHLENSPVDFAVFTSSTSVYPDSLKVAGEDASIVPDNDRARILLETEQVLFKNKSFDTTIIRFAGLFGADRKIGCFLSERKSLRGGSRPVNLIHLDDCVSIIAGIIEQDIRGEIFNACCDEHPQRKELYQKAALKLGLKPPMFDESDRSTGKVVDNQKIRRRLNYQFKYPDPASA